MEERVARAPFVVPDAADGREIVIPVGARLRCKPMPGDGLWEVYYGKEFCAVRQHELFQSTEIVPTTAE